MTFKTTSLLRVFFAVAIVSTPLIVKDQRYTASNKSLETPTTHEKKTERTKGSSSSRIASVMMPFHHTATLQRQTSSATSISSTRC